MMPTKAELVAPQVVIATTSGAGDCRYGNLQCSATNDDRGFSGDSRLAPSQWETSLHSNAVSYLLGANLKSALWLPREFHFMNCHKSLANDNAFSSCMTCIGVVSESDYRTCLCWKEDYLKIVPFGGFLLSLIIPMCEWDDKFYW